MTTPIESNASAPMKRRDLLLSILIPVYNEQAYLVRVVESVIAAPLPDGLSREIILVDDASTDRTPLVIEEITKKYSDVIRAFRQPKNCGKSAAIRRAIQEMRGDFAIIQDADLEYDPNEYPLILAPLLDGRADVVYGSRFASRETRKVLLYHHKLGNLFLTHLSNFTTGLDLTDMETCYKAFRGDALKSIPLRSNRFGIEPEITAKIAKRGWTVYEVPISYNGRRYSEGKKIGWKDGVSAICIILKYWFLDDSFFDEDSDASSRQRFESSRNYCKSLVKLATPSLGSSVLEIGAGFGSFSRYIPQKERLTLAESDARQLEFLRASYDGNAVVDVARVDLSDPEFSWDATFLGAFDSVACFDRLHELPLTDACALQRAREVLKPNGRLVFAVKARKKSAKRDASENAFTKDEIVSALSNAGFKAVKVQSFAAAERLFRRSNSKTAPSQLRLKLFDMVVGRAQWLNKVLPVAHYFVVAEKE